MLRQWVSALECEPAREETPTLLRASFFRPRSLLVAKRSQTGKVTSAPAKASAFEFTPTNLVVVSHNLCVDAMIHGNTATELRLHAPNAPPTAICTATGPASALPHLHRDCGSPLPQSLAAKRRPGACARIARAVAHGGWIVRQHVANGATVAAAAAALAAAG